MKLRNTLDFIAFSAKYVIIAMLTLSLLTFVWCVIIKDINVSRYFLVLQYIGGTAAAIGCLSVFGNMSSGSITANQQVYMGMKYTRDFRDIDRSIAFTWLMLIAGGLTAMVGITVYRTLA